MDRQLELFEASADICRADPAEVRAELFAILARARAARAWPPADVWRCRAAFPQLTAWLPEAEGAQLRFEFDAAMARLEAA